MKDLNMKVDIFFNRITNRIKQPVTIDLSDLKVEEITSSVQAYLAKFSLDGNLWGMMPRVYTSRR